MPAIEATLKRYPNVEPWMHHEPMLTLPGGRTAFARGMAIESRSAGSSADAPRTRGRAPCLGLSFLYGGALGFAYAFPG
jgi:hypothetical protein